MSTKDLLFIFCITGPIVSTFISILLFLSSIVFNKNDFQNKKIYRYISINAATDACLLLFASSAPITFYFSSISTNLTTIYYLESFNYYGLICFGFTLKTISEHLTIYIALYRLIELSKFRRFNKKLNIYLVIFFIFILSILTTWPVYTWCKIVSALNGTSFKTEGNLIFIYDYNFTEITMNIRRLLNILNFLLIIGPNIYFIVVLKNLFVKRRQLKRFRPNQTDSLMSHTNESTHCFQLLSITNQEIRVSLLVGSISLIQTFDMLLKFVYEYFTYTAEIDPEHQLYGYIIGFFCVCGFNFMHFLSYFCLNCDYRKNFQFLFC